MHLRTRKRYAALLFDYAASIAIPSWSRTMLSVLRQNLSLKIFALLAAILLYGYVQAERDPTISRTLIATVYSQNVAAGLEVENPQPQLEVTVTGPRSVIDRLKDGDIRADADLANLPTNEAKTTLIRVKFITVTLPAEMARTLTFDPPTKTIHVQSFPQQARMLSVMARYPKDPPAGYRYGPPEVYPPSIKVSGRLDRMAHVAQVIANAAPTELGANIDGEFAVSARDSENKPVDGIVVEPTTVHVKVLLVEEPLSKIVPVSPNITDQPLPAYKINGITVTPNQVHISGRPGKVNTAYTVLTDEISVRDLTDSREFHVNLQVPPDLTVHDMDGRPVKLVVVRISIAKVAVPEPPSPQTSTSPSSQPPRQ